MQKERLTRTEFYRTVQETVQAAKSAPLMNSNAWWRNYEEAKNFKDEKGHCSFLAGSKLYHWQDSSRKKWQKGNLDGDKIAALKELGIERTRSPFKSINKQINDPAHVEAEKVARTMYRLQDEVLENRAQEHRKRVLEADERSRAASYSHQSLSL